MFLQQVYKHSKWLFLLMIIFITGQLFVGYKHGLVVSPFYNYGMYSEVIKIKDSYEVWEIEVNNKVLSGQDFSPQQWDRILMPVQYYAAISSSNLLYKTEIKRLLEKLHLTAGEDRFIQSCDYNHFHDWYIKYLGGVISKTVTGLAIRRKKFRYDSNKLIATNSATALADLCH